MYEDIKSTITIGMVLERYGYYAPHRNVYRIPCPIHRGKDANFSVSESDGLWNCFSVCGRGGSVIDLIMELEKVPMVEAVQKLRNDFHVTTPQRSVVIARTYASQVERYKKMKQDNIVELPPHRQLEEGYRGLTRETIKHWGLARTNSGVLIPLVSKDGKPCSYSIRRDDGNPKYDNAKGISKCYPFGLFQNQHDIVREGFAYLVEAQLDCVKLWQNGYKNVISIMGSQVSEQQAMLILILTSSLVLVMDGDEVGRKASREITKKWGNIFKIKVINIPFGKDPDELTQEELERYFVDAHH